MPNERLRAALLKQGLTPASLAEAVGVDTNGRVAIDWGVYGMPETFVVDGKGRIVYKHVGPISIQALESQVIPAIEAARKTGSAS